MWTPMAAILAVCCSVWGRGSAPSGRVEDPPLHGPSVHTPVRPGIRLAEIPKSVQVRINTSSSFLTDRKSTRLNSSHVEISYAVFCLKKKKKKKTQQYSQTTLLL